MNYQTDNNFWFDCWKNNNLGFNQQAPNPTLIEFFSTFSIPKKSRAFIPLCGKSVDMIWLLEQGLEVVGIELSPLAIQAFFEENRLLYGKKPLGPFNLWEAKEKPITILEGDIFLLDSSNIEEFNFLKKSPFHFIYDRASLIALPHETRINYYNLYKKLMNHKTKALLLTIEYNSSDFKGPPFSVPEEEVINSLENDFEVNLLKNEKVKTLSPRFLESGLEEVSQKAYKIEKLE